MLILSLTGEPYTLRTDIRVAHTANLYNAAEKLCMRPPCAATKAWLTQPLCVQTRPPVATAMAPSYTPSKDLTFYYAPGSSASITEAVLAELGIDSKMVMLNPHSFGEDGTHTPEYLAINPNGAIPTIVHEGAAIWEAAAITIYLGETFGVDAGLWPAPGPERGQALKWVAWGSVSLHAAGGRIGEQLPKEHPGAADEAITMNYTEPKARAEDGLAKAKKGMDKLLKVRSVYLSCLQCLLYNILCCAVLCCAVLCWCSARRWRHLQRQTLPSSAAWAVAVVVHVLRLVVCCRCWTVLCRGVNFCSGATPSRTRTSQCSCGGSRRWMWSSTRTQTWVHGSTAVWRVPRLASALSKFERDARA